MGQCCSRLFCIEQDYHLKPLNNQVKKITLSAKGEKLVKEKKEQQQHIIQQAKQKQSSNSSSINNNETQGKDSKFDWEIANAAIIQAYKSDMKIIDIREESSHQSHELSLLQSTQPPDLRRLYSNSAVGGSFAGNNSGVNSALLFQPEEITILVVDESQTIHEMLEKWLNHERYQSIMCYDGDEVYEVLSNSASVAADGIVQDIDLIVCDSVIEMQNGQQLLDWIQTQPAFAHIPVVLLTHEVGPSAERLIRRGAADVVSKPLQRNVLINTITTLLKTRHTQKTIQLLKQQGDEYKQQVIQEKQSSSQKSIRTPASPASRTLLQLPNFPSPIPSSPSINAPSNSSSTIPLLPSAPSLSAQPSSIPPNQPIHMLCMIDEQEISEKFKSWIQQLPVIASWFKYLPEALLYLQESSIIMSDRQSSLHTNLLKNITKRSVTASAAGPVEILLLSQSNVKKGSQSIQQWLQHPKQIRAAIPVVILVDEIGPSEDVKSLMKSIPVSTIHAPFTKDLCLNKLSILIENLQNKRQAASLAHRAAAYRALVAKYRSGKGNTTPTSKSKGAFTFGPFGRSVTASKYAVTDNTLDLNTPNDPESPSINRVTKGRFNFNNKYQSHSENHEPIRHPLSVVTRNTPPSARATLESTTTQQLPPTPILHDQQLLTQPTVASSSPNSTQRSTSFPIITVSNPTPTSNAPLPHSVPATTVTSPESTAAPAPSLSVVTDRRNSLPVPQFMTHSSDQSSPSNSANRSNSNTSANTAYSSPNLMAEAKIALASKLQLGESALRSEVNPNSAIINYAIQGTPMLQGSNLNQSATQRNSISLGDSAVYFTPPRSYILNKNFDLERPPRMSAVLESINSTSVTATPSFKPAADTKLNDNSILSTTVMLPTASMLGSSRTASDTNITNPSAVAVPSNVSPDSTTSPQSRSLNNGQSSAALLNMMAKLRLNDQFAATPREEDQLTS